jgi:hypothetical protein
VLHDITPELLPSVFGELECSQSQNATGTGISPSGPGKTHSLLDQCFAGRFGVEGVSRLTDKGTLAGILITINKAFTNLVTVCDIDTVMAARFTSTNAARQMGIMSP